jgi:endonuclease/exonuclease/phosphatase family metal-dependent hydrolase
MKLISCNIEGHTHLAERVMPFLLREQPDVVCLQEVFKVDVPKIERELGMVAHYQPMADVDQVSIHQAHALGEWGVVVLTRLENPTFGASYYVKKGDQLPIFFANNDPNSMHRVLIWVTAEHEGQQYTVVTTHFTWSPKGAYIKEQAEASQAMFAELAKLPPHVVCGDFNSPRNNPGITELAGWQVLPGENIFQQLAKKYTDSIPASEMTSIDGSLQLMVDGMFAQPEYQVTNCKLVAGVSDHKAVVAEVTRVA